MMQYLPVPMGMSRLAVELRSAMLTVVLPPVGPGRRRGGPNQLRGGARFVGLARQRADRHPERLGEPIERLHVDPLPAALDLADRQRADPGRLGQLALRPALPSPRGPQSG